MFNLTNSDDGTRTINHCDSCTFRDIQCTFGFSLPNIAIDLYASIATGLDCLHHLAMTTYQGIGITHTSFIMTMEIAQRHRTHQEQADKRKDSEEH